MVDNDGQRWFDDARLGMFIHWSHCSQAGLELSWPLVGGVASLPGCPSIPVAEYERTAATFAPAPGAAREWARLAKAAGMAYAVFTAKHHDGFAMFDTKLSDYSVMHSAAGRDLVREYVDAFREAGLHVGLYFSLADWHHPDYPAVTDEDKPYRWGRWSQPTAEGWARFQVYMTGQLTELLSNYGKIDVIWFDGGWERTPDQWQCAELEALIRRLQPGILINDRLPGRGDYATPEQFIPPAPPSGRWESCMTMNETWGFCPADTGYKSAIDLIHGVCETAARGGNLLLNVSPGPTGALPPEQVERLEAMARWMAAHGESVTGTRPGLEPWQFYGPSTRRGSIIYLHALARPYEAVTVRGVHVRRVKSVKHLASGEPLGFSARVSAMDQVFGKDPVGELRILVPQRLVDAAATVIALDLEE